MTVAPAAPAAQGAPAFAPGLAWDDSNRRHGSQFIGGSAPSSSSYREPSALRGGPRD
jgi:hypothetical protein